MYSSKKNSNDVVGNIKYRNIPCSEMSEEEISQTSKLFSENYGFWSDKCPNSKLRGKRIIFTNEMIKRNFVNKQDRFVTMAYVDNELAGHIFYLKRKGYKTKDIIWILQLVVAKKFRGSGIATKLMHSIWQLSNCYAWGLYTSNPMTIKVLEKATMRKVDVKRINEKFDRLKSAAQDIFEDGAWLTDYKNGIVNTNFFVDHTDLKDRIRRVYSDGTFPFDEDLPEGHEWLAFTFHSQKAEIPSIEEYLDYSKDILKQAYSGMKMEDQAWTKHTPQEVDYFLEKEYIRQTDKVIDVGCGRGRHVIELNNRGIDAIGIDFSAENIKFALEKNKDKFLCQDILEYEIQNKYDVALCLYDVIGSFPSQKDNFKILKSIYKCLQPNGKVILSVMNMELTLRRCKNKTDNIKRDIKKLLSLEASDTMQQTGDVFEGKYMLIDIFSGIIYRKEQFFFEDALPCEYIVRDKRYFFNEITGMVERAGFVVDDSFCFNAGDIFDRLESSSPRAKEIFIVAHKPK